MIGELMCNVRVDLGSYLAGEVGDLKELVDEGLAEVDDLVVRATPLGRLFIRHLAMVFDAHLEQARADRPRFSSTV